VREGVKEQFKTTEEYDIFFSKWVEYRNKNWPKDKFKQSNNDYNTFIKID